MATPTEIKAQIKAKELIDMYSTTNISDNPKTGWLMPRSVGVYFAIKSAEEVLETLNSMKGIAKISKVTFWKKVKENLENEH
ncbi:MAG: hypothetical protein QM499_01075 [Flavobacteriaceae bacterium]